MEFKEPKAVSLSNVKQDVYLDLPEVCPHCLKAIEPRIESVSKLALFSNKFALLLFCPACKSFFIQPYHYCIEDKTAIGKMFPYEINPKINLDLPKELEKVSPEFIEIYKESLTAEFYGLNKIVGIGFRKSIEFLVKDYLINFLGKDESSIKNVMLGVAINQIDNSKIKVLSRAAAWIGNDETHYERRYEDKDINDMKKFIKALAHFISFELVAMEASDFTASSIAK